MTEVRAIELIKKYALLETKIENVHREDRLNIPLKALREGVINAIVHADYSKEQIIG